MSNACYKPIYASAGAGHTLDHDTDGLAHLKTFEAWRDDQPEGSLGDRAETQWLDYCHVQLEEHIYACIRKAYIDGFMRGFELRLTGGNDERN